MGIEIEITADMVEAGVQAYREWEESEDTQIEHAVRLILAAALQAAGGESE
jgi:hypothetical protein